MKKFFLPLIFELVLVFLLLPSSASAVASIDFPGSFAGLTSQNLKDTISNIVRIVFGFLGILAIIAIIYGGLKIMTSGGNADQTGDGKKAAVAGLIGLIIVLAAYSIAGFVINSLITAV